MKRINFIALILAICMMMPLIVSGSDAGSNVIEYSDENVTVIFEGDSHNGSYYKRIADKLVYGDETAAVPILSWCWLFGHDLSTENVSVITHKVNSTSPRCLRTIYKVETCSKCDYYQKEVVSTAYIVCCPND